MKPLPASLSTEEMALKMGRQVRAWRIQQGFRQADLALKSGVGEVALRRLERGEGVSFSTFFKVLDALGKLSRMEALLDPVRISPMDALSRNLAVPGKPFRVSSSHSRRARNRGCVESGRPVEPPPPRSSAGGG